MHVELLQLRKASEEGQTLTCDLQHCVLHDPELQLLESSAPGGGGRSRPPPPPKQSGTPPPPGDVRWVGIKAWGERNGLLFGFLYSEINIGTPLSKTPDRSMLWLCGMVYPCLKNGSQCHSVATLALPTLSTNQEQGAKSIKMSCNVTHAFLPFTLCPWNGRFFWEGGGACKGFKTFV